MQVVPAFSAQHINQRSDLKGGKCIGSNIKVSKVHILKEEFKAWRLQYISETVLLKPYVMLSTEYIPRFCNICQNNNVIYTLHFLRD